MAHASIVIGLGFGDEGKGSWVDHLVRRDGVQYVVRFNGGAQAMHHVVTSEGREHGFSQFASGTLVPGTFTCLSRFMLIEPEALVTESRALDALGVSLPLSRVIASMHAPVITPFNRVLNRIMEIARGASRHGSCGFGIGLTQQDVEELGQEALYLQDLRSDRLRRKLRNLHELKLEAARPFATPENRELRETLATVDLEYYESFFRSFANQIRLCDEREFLEIIRANDTVFEGAQGVLLDQQHGFFPHCTRSNCTFENAELLLRESGFDGQTTRIGLLRGYATRHGAGPFVTEDTNLSLPPCHNGTNPWQGKFRLGWFDAVATRYALEMVGGVDVLALTNLDRMNGLERIQVANAYERADSRFFSSDRIFRLWNAPLSQLAERTATMEQIKPTFDEFPGWNASDTRKRERYLEAISEMIEHPIGAMSETSDHRKHYREGLFAALARIA